MDSNRVATPGIRERIAGIFPGVNYFRYDSSALPKELDIFWCHSVNLFVPEAPANILTGL